MKRLLQLVLGLVLCSVIATLGPNCNSGDDLLRAKVIEHRSEAVGGPVSMADIGDFLLENDQIRVAILRAIDSPGPGAYGGSIVDIDRRRPWIGFEGGQGRDRFAEAFPVANLLVPEPTATEVSVLKDGSDGMEASIRVTGEGGFFIQALGILRHQAPLLETFFPGVLTRMRFTTDYILRPGWRHVLMRTTLELGDEVEGGCPLIDHCPQCTWGHAQTPEGCLDCNQCSDRVPLQPLTQPDPVFRTLLGDPAGEPGSTLKAGIVAGDFVFFGNQNDVFAPGPGFDEGWAVHHAFDIGRNTFQEPLSYDFVAAAGGDISYGYFTVGREGQDPPKVNVPLITSAATAFMSHGHNCLLDSSDDGTCDLHRSFVYERYLAVGDGDIASVAEVVHDVRGTQTGELVGHVLWDETGEPVPNAQVMVFSDPDHNRTWRTVDHLVEANLEARDDFGLVNAIDADLGLDRVEDGDFHAKLPPGRYVLVAQTRDDSAVSKPVQVRVRAGGQTVAVPRLPTPAKVAYRITDDSGLLIPAKLMFISVDESGRPLEGDGQRRPYMGHSRFGNGRKHLVLTTTGQGEVELPPGRYSYIASRGVEYSIAYENNFELHSGRLKRVDAMIRREVDTTGWASMDSHLHSTLSFDSGLPVPVRVASLVAEGVDLAIATDHDVKTDYRPYVRELLLEPFIKTVVSEEITTLEQGHFVAFPLKYDELKIPGHGAFDWTCVSVGAMLDWARNDGDGMDPLTIVAHPNDGFFGYFSQLGVDAYTLGREMSLFEENNPVFRTATCQFDAMEVFNAKRLELIRTPTVQEVVDWNRCTERINAATDIAELAAACPEMSSGLAASCSETERFGACQDRNRTALAWAAVKRVLTRTPAEQAENWHFAGTQPESEELCDLQALGADPVPAEDADKPCTIRAGTVDVFFRLLEHGMTPAQVGGSDSHGHDKEPGTPRTYYRSSTDNPAHLSVEEATTSLRNAHAFVTYGPFIRASIDGKTYGEVVRAAPQSNLSLDLQVQTASWFGVDRLEVYLNGELIRESSPAEPVSAIVDVDGTVTFSVPARDSWVVVIAMGLSNDRAMRLVSLDLPWGELELSKIAADAFSRVPMISSLFPAPPTLPNWGPIPAYAMTNPIYIDTDGNGRYDAPLPSPDFCSRPCDPSSPNPDQCPTGQTCLNDEEVCGIAISGRCNRYPVTFGD